VINNLIPAVNLKVTHYRKIDPIPEITDCGEWLLRASRGNRDHTGNFYFIHSDVYWWTSSAYDATTAWSRLPGYDYAQVYRCYYYGMYSGFSVRCVRDQRLLSTPLYTPSCRS
jgi:hypothetical protein